MKFQLYGTAETTQFFDIKAKTTWSAVIYAPNADIDLYANGDFKGSKTSCPLQQSRTILRARYFR